MKRHCRIIVFEGPDKSGKETQSRLAVSTLVAAGKRARRVEVPCRECPRTHKLIYWMLGNGWARKLPNVFQFVQFLNKWFFQRSVLPRLERENDVVVLDRWRLSAVVYGNATGVNPKFNLWIHDRLRAADLTIVFAERSFRRSSTQDDSYERDTELQARVRDGYREWVASHPADHALVDNTGNRFDVHEKVYDLINPPNCSCGQRSC